MKLYETYLEKKDFNQKGRLQDIEEVMLQFTFDGIVEAAFIYSEVFGDWMEIDIKSVSFNSKYTQEKIDEAIAKYWEATKLNSADSQAKADRVG